MNVFRFTPLLKQTIWGGDKIIPFKHLKEDISNVGESWEISGVKGKETVVADGPYKGWTLRELVTGLKDRLVGKTVYDRCGNDFPLLVKFIDARSDLSIQVHPTDDIAVRQGKDSGKTEMWYVMESEPDAKLRTGLKREITPVEYRRMVEDGTICDAIAEYNVCEGDCFFLPAGRIHSIGAGCFLAEIQQSSDVTYRIYDFKRRDKDGKYRELHTGQAAEAIDYTVYDNYRTEYACIENERRTLVSCPYFTTSVFDVNTTEHGSGHTGIPAAPPVVLDYSTLDSFVILVCVKGGGILTDSAGESMRLRAGDTILIPATETHFEVSGSIRFLETY